MAQGEIGITYDSGIAKFCCRMLSVEFCRAWCTNLNNLQLFCQQGSVWPPILLPAGKSITSKPRPSTKMAGNWVFADIPG